VVTGLVDSSIIVDLIRGFPDAHQWLKTMNDELGITYYVWSEVIQGAPNKQKQASSIKILSDFHLIEITPEDTKWAVQALIKTRLAYNVDAFDSFIASTAYRLQIPLYTRNLKHFTPLIGQLAQTPF